jgi:hypothetical protein
VDAAGLETIHEPPHSAGQSWLSVILSVFAWIQTGSWSAASLQMRRYTQHPLAMPPELDADLQRWPRSSTEVAARFTHP